MEKKLVDALVGWLRIRSRPGSIWSLSGMQKAAIRKLRLKKKKKPFRNCRSERVLRRFTRSPPNSLSVNLIKP